MKRIKIVSQAKDQRKFTRTAKKIKKINVSPFISRGGIRL